MIELHGGDVTEGRSRAGALSEIGRILFVVLAIGEFVQAISRLDRDAPANVRAELLLVYAIGVLGSYWLIERLMGIFRGTA